MDLLRIAGPRPLQGTVSISGSKNAALPVMAASLLTDQVLELRNVPDIEDIEAMAAMLSHLGVAVDRLSSTSWRLQAGEVRSIDVGADLTRRMRGSFLLLGALIARTGEAAIAKPGGDDIGMRRVEQHLEGLRLMGAEVEERADMYAARAPRLRGARIDLDIPTVTGTENLIMAAVLAEGITVIANAAREPHVFDLVRCLVGMGAHIAGAGSELIVIEGQTRSPPRNHPQRHHRLHRGGHVHGGRCGHRRRRRRRPHAPQRRALAHQQAAQRGRRRRRGSQPGARARRGRCTPSTSPPGRIPASPPTFSRSSAR